MVRAERHGHRDLRYSKWHRDKLSGGCYATDLDWIEWRNGDGIVAFVETKIGLNTQITDFQKKVFSELEERSGIPVYIVNHSQELDRFKVTQNGVGKRLDESEFIEFMENLGRVEFYADDRDKLLSEVM